MEDVSMRLGCRLTDGELAERAQDLASKIQDERRVRGEKKRAMAEYGAALEAIEEDISRLGTTVQTKSEPRPVNCRWFPHVRSGFELLVRLDTYAVIQRREMPRQSTLEDRETIELNEAYLKEHGVVLEDLEPKAGWEIIPTEDEPALGSVDPTALAAAQPLADALAQVERPISATVVANWTEEQRKVAFDWSTAVHAKAQGHEVDVPEEPAHVVAAMTALREATAAAEGANDDASSKRKAKASKKPKAKGGGKGKSRK